MDIAKYIDHTLLRPDASKFQIVQHCREAALHNFVSVCVNPMWVRESYHTLYQDKSTKICTVIGFPSGANLPKIKSAEAYQALADGADELDMVLNIGWLKSGYFPEVEMDIWGVRKTAKHAILKVIIETCLLTREEKIIACKIAKNAGADFVKTSTGFSTSGATVEDVKLMRITVGPDMGVKASGGIKDFATAKAMIDAGANRIGTSSGVVIVEESKKGIAP